MHADKMKILFFLYNVIRNVDHFYLPNAAQTGPQTLTPARFIHSNSTHNIIPKAFTAAPHVAWKIYSKFEHHHQEWLTIFFVLAYYEIPQAYTFKGVAYFVYRPNNGPWEHIYSAKMKMSSFREFQRRPSAPAFAFHHLSTDCIYI